MTITPDDARAYCLARYKLSIYAVGDDPAWEPLRQANDELRAYWRMCLEVASHD